MILDNSSKMLCSWALMQKQFFPFFWKMSCDRGFAVVLYVLVSRARSQIAPRFSFFFRSCVISFSRPPPFDWSVAPKGPFRHFPQPMKTAPRSPTPPCNGHHMEFLCAVAKQQEKCAYVRAVKVSNSVVWILSQIENKTRATWRL